MSNSVTLCKEKFIGDIGRDIFLNSFRSFEYDFDTVCVSNMKEAGEYNSENRKYAKYAQIGKKLKEYDYAI